jgi:hypothetical protein
LASQGFVPASYLRLASGRLATEGPGPALLVGRDDRTQPIDVEPGAPAVPLRVRANSAERRAAALRVTLASRQDGEAVLEGGGHVRTLPLPRGRGTFLGLEPGRYRLKVSDRDGARAWKDLTFRDRVLAEVRIGEAQQTTAGGAKR